MAVAARPGASDARVPCPLCGGLIHPIAGKCKHCKADLTSYHAARPAAKAPLPALHQARGGNGHAHGHAPADAAQGPIAHAVPVPVAAMYEASQPVLPPRPTGRSYPTEPRASGWRSWPVVVIVLAMVAIVVAVVLMVWPASRRDVDGKHTIAPPPAPERMQTAPDIATPPQASPNARPVPPVQDPWSPRPAAPGPADPGAQATDPLDPADSTDPNDGDADLGTLKNPFDSPHVAPARPGRHRLKINTGGIMYLAMAEHMCRKILQCGDDNPVARSMCDKLSHHAPPANCPAAERCLEQIDTLSCGAQSSDPLQLRRMITQFSDCAEAVRC
jgi:hypothetical protein